MSGLRLYLREKINETQNIQVSPPPQPGQSLKSKLKTCLSPNDSLKSLKRKGTLEIRSLNLAFPPWMGWIRKIT